MDTRAPQQQKGAFYAGLYLRTGHHARFWGWGKPTPRQAEQTRPSLAEAARSHPPEEASPPGRIPAAGLGRARRRLQVVCERHFIGFVIR